MGSVLERGGRWYLKWTDAGGKRQRKVCSAATKGQAKLLLAEIELKVDRQRRGLEERPSDTALTLGELCDWWLKNRCSPNSLSRERARLGCRVSAYPISGAPVRSVTTEMLQAHLDMLARANALAPATINKLRGTLMSVFSGARKAKLWTGPDPVSGVERRRVIRRPHATLRVEEVPLLLAKVSGDWRNFFAAAIYLALRKGELCGLLKSDIDWDVMTLRVARSYGYDTTKGGHADVLPIPEPLIPFLRDAVARSPSRWVFPGPDGKMRGEDCAPHKILRTALSHAGIVDGFEYVCRRCKAEGKREHTWMRPDANPRRCNACEMRLWVRAVPRKMVFHDLRHTTATLLLRAKVPMAHVQKILRHANVHTTLSTYGHLDVEDLRVGMEKIAPMTEVEAQRLVASSGSQKLGPSRVQEETEPETGGRTTEEILRGISELMNGRTGNRTQDHRLVRASTEVAPDTTIVSKRQQSFRKSRGSDSQQSSGLGAVGPRSGPGRVHLRAVPADARMLTAGEVARLLRVSKATVYRLCESGALRHLRVLNAVRVSESDILDFVRGGGVQ